LQLQKKQNQQEQNLIEKDKMILKLQDELTASQLENHQLELQCSFLKSENESLVERWLTKMNQDASQMNDANRWVEKHVFDLMLVYFRIKKYLKLQMISQVIFLLDMIWHRLLYILDKVLVNCQKSRR
jgi:hypothetical protein